MRWPTLKPIEEGLKLSRIENSHPSAQKPSKIKHKIIDMGRNNENSKWKLLVPKKKLQRRETQPKSKIREARALCNSKAHKAIYLIVEDTSQINPRFFHKRGILFSLIN